LNSCINEEAPITKRVFPPPRQTARQGDTRRGAGFFCYFSCPPRKVEEKRADGNHFEIRKAIMKNILFDGKIPKFQLFICGSITIIGSLSTPDQTKLPFEPIALP